MSRPTEQSEQQQVHEGTETLKDIAAEVEAEREKSSGKTSIPSDEAEQAVGPPADAAKDPHAVDSEDPLSPEDEDTTPVLPPVRPMI